MNEQEKAAFLFSYLGRFQDTCKRYGNIEPAEATLLYFNKIELFKLQLQQNGITMRFAQNMFMRLTSSLLTQYLFERRDGRLWQLLCEPFEYPADKNQDAELNPTE